MNKHLTEKEIKDLIKKERKNTSPYKDEVDLAIDNVINLYESKRISEDYMRILISLIVSTTTRQTILNLSNELMKSNLNIKAEEPNKLLLVNYSKKSYA